MAETELWVRENQRGITEYFISKTHKRIDELWAIIRTLTAENVMETTEGINENDLDELRRYICKIDPRARYPVPNYPKKVEFHVSSITHVTHMQPLDEINRSGGFRSGMRQPGFLWWGLLIDEEEISNAEVRYLDQIFPERTQNQRDAQDPGFLQTFTSSPVFNQASRYGNFKFTFTLNDVMEAYKEHICNNQDPKLKVYETVFYKQEVMYVVLVHSPDVHDYDDYPVLGDNDDGVCAYRDGKIIWRAQAISETHRFRLSVHERERNVTYSLLSKNQSEHYVWDHVTLAFDMPNQSVLQFENLFETLTYCDICPPKLNPPCLREEAEDKIKTLQTA